MKENVLNILFLVRFVRVIQYLLGLCLEPFNPHHGSNLLDPMNVAACANGVLMQPLRIFCVATSGTEASRT